ncbi:Uma2 family endonuclease [Bernardetia sp. Wsw4-3y2]|uniref:Uma2 family endonuclease n=1 Tax=Bernardetia sp. Wsw4-3y2 TaxID=3127471 RepID=UPI0030CFD245
MKTLVLQTDNSSDLNLLKELAERLGITYFETDNSIQESEIKTDTELKIINYEEKDNYTFEDIKKIAAQFPIDYKWTYQDLVNYFPQDLSVKVEIINNQLFIMPSPEQDHQEIVGELFVAFKHYAKLHKLGKVIVSPFDVVFDEDNTVIPDVIFVSVQRMDILDGKKAQGAPDLAVEVWSKGNKKKEREAKRELYQKNKVTEFWQIYPKKKQVFVEVLNEKGKYQVFSEAEKEGSIKSKVLTGFEIDITDIFED